MNNCVVCGHNNVMSFPNDDACHSCNRVVENMLDMLRTHGSWVDPSDPRDWVRAGADKTLAEKFVEKFVENWD